MSVFLRRIAAVEELARMKLSKGVAVVEQRGDVYIYEGKEYTENMLHKQFERMGVDVAIIIDV